MKRCSEGIQRCSRGARLKIRLDKFLYRIGSKVFLRKFLFVVGLDINVGHMPREALHDGEECAITREKMLRDAL